MEVQQFKFCMNCGSKMPGTNKFCTNCGIKLSDRQPIVQPPNVPDSVSNEKAAQYELTLGKSCLNGTGVQKNYEQAALHLKKAAASGSSEAPVLLAVAYLYQAIDILRYTQYLPAANEVSVQNGISGTHTAANNNRVKNNTGNSSGSKLATAGKYAAAAAAGALASTLLHNNAAAGEQTYRSPAYIPAGNAPSYGTQSPEYIQQQDNSYQEENPSLVENEDVQDNDSDFSSDSDYDNAGDLADSADDTDGSFFGSDDDDSIF